MSHCFSSRSRFGFPLLRYSLIVSFRVAVALTLGLALRPVAGWAAASQIKSITPSCAAVGEHSVITGNGFGSQNVTVKVGGVPAQVLSATGNRVTFTVPAEVSGGVTVVTATNPGGQTGGIAFRVKMPEVCGDQTDDDCDGQLDDPDVCVVTNHAPVAQAGADTTASVGTTVFFDGTASSDPDGNPLTFQWSFVGQPTGSTATLANPTSPTSSFLLAHPGTYIVQVLVSDGSLTHTDSVTVSTVNSAPVAEAGTGQSGPIGTIITLDGSTSSDVDGNLLTYQWTLVSKPTSSLATLTAPNSLTPSFTIDVFGDYVVQLLVHDGTTSSTPDTVTISTLNSAPIAKASTDQSAHVGETVTLDGSSSSDLDGNPLTFHWGLTSRPTDSSAVLQHATTAQPTVTIDKPGTYVAHLVVNDGIASSAADTVIISTLNSKPVANAGTDQSGTVGTTIQLDGNNSSDVDGDPLTTQWSLTTTPAGSAATLQNPTILTPSFVIDKPGTYIGQLLVHDGTVESTPDTVLITTLNSKDDTHIVFTPGADPYEGWVDAVRGDAKRRPLFSAALNSPPVQPPKEILTATGNLDAPLPIARLIDSDQFDGTDATILSTPALGLAEYTNGNFVSADTIFTTDFLLPRQQSLLSEGFLVDDGAGNQTRYFSKVGGGEQVTYFLAEGVWYDRSLKIAKRP
jgi:hypothetical protein